MKISLQDVGKRYNRDWIFRHFTYQFISGFSYAITGANGSGKSTLLKVISGGATHSEGQIIFENIAPEKVFKHISFVAPYLDLIEEMTLLEFFKFHRDLKKWLPDFDIMEICKRIDLEIAVNKQIRNFSSGMKQRVKLATAFFSDVPVILLDEPTTNLDAEGIHLYKTLMEEYSKTRLLIVSSNSPYEYDFCDHVIDMKSIKPSSLSPAGN